MVFDLYQADPAQDCYARFRDPVATIAQDPCRLSRDRHILTLPALQRHSVKIIFDLGVINGGDFGEFSVVSVSQAMKHEIFLMGCFPGIFDRKSGPLEHSGKQPIKGGKPPIVENDPLKIAH